MLLTIQTSSTVTEIELTSSQIILHQPIYLKKFYASTVLKKLI